MANPISEFLNKFIKEKYIQPAIAPFQKEIALRDEFIKSSTGTGNEPWHFVTPIGVSENFGQDVYRWKNMVDFRTLREFSERYDVARACINRRKRQVEGAGWSIKTLDPKDKIEKYQKQVDFLVKFFRRPEGGNVRFREFIGPIVEDLLVFDGACIWKDALNDGTLERLIVVDSETIRLRVLEDGSTPLAPEPAYEQWIRGEKKAQFSTDEMYYVMMNPRSNTPYGLSPLEGLILSVDAALKSQLYNLSMLTEGNIPEGFVKVPPEWTPQEIKDYQIWWDSFISGNPRFQSKIKFIPGGKGVGYEPTKKPEEMKFLEYEKWLLKKTCAMFDVPPEEIGFTESVNRATAEQQGEVANKAGLIPLLETIKEIFDDIIQTDFGFTQLQWNWNSLDSKDEKKEAEVAQILIPIGAMSVDEFRQERGLDPIGLDHYVMAGGNPILVKDIVNPPEVTTEAPKEETSKEAKPAKEEEKPKSDEEKVIEDVEKWKRKVLKDIKDEKNIRGFESEYIDKGLKTLIETDIILAKGDKEKIKQIFNDHITRLKNEKLLMSAIALSDEINESIKSYDKSTN